MKETDKEMTDKIELLANEIADGWTEEKQARFDDAVDEAYQRAGLTRS